MLPLPPLLPLGLPPRLTLPPLVPRPELGSGALDIPTPFGDGTSMASEAIGLTLGLGPRPLLPPVLACFRDPGVPKLGIEKLVGVLWDVISFITAFRASSHCGEPRSTALPLLARTRARISFT